MQEAGVLESVKLGMNIPERSHDSAVLSNTYVLLSWWTWTKKSVAKN
jgi:hypothetical protein